MVPIQMFLCVFYKSYSHVLFQSVGNGVMVYIVPHGLSDSMVPVQVFLCVFYKSYSQSLVSVCGQWRHGLHHPSKWQYGSSTGVFVCVFYKSYSQCLVWVCGQWCHGLHHPSWAFLNCENKFNLHLKNY